MDEEKDESPNSSEARANSEGPSSCRGRQRSISLILPSTSTAETLSLLANATHESEVDEVIQPTDGNNLNTHAVSPSISDVSLAAEFLPAPTPVYIQSEADLRPREKLIGPNDLMKSEPVSIAHCPLTPEPSPSVTTPVFFPRKETQEEIPKMESHEKIFDPKPTTGRIRNQSEIEINNQHYQMQKQYRNHNNQRKRHLTDIDFEGILKIIGGCNLWQVIIYLMISSHQISHSMFNLSVVYMTYQPDHWCKVPGFSRSYFETHQNDIHPNWTWQKALESGVAFPLGKNRQRRGKIWHDQCSYYNLPPSEYKKYLRMDPQMALKMVGQRNRSTLIINRCKDWDYDDSVMKDTIVMQWNRVCDDNWSRAHVHLSYSLGYLVGCIAGGFVSDRYGRKTAIYGFSVLSTIFGFLLPFSREFEVFLVVRFLLAVCNEAADLAAYVLCMEITGVKYRSLVGSLLQAPWACGYALLALIAYIFKSWVQIQLITTFLHFLSLFLIHRLPESPRWLVVMNRIDEAERIIRRACHLNKSSLPSDLGLVRHAELRKWKESIQRPHFIDTFYSKAMGLRNIILFIVWVATALVYYGLVIALSDQSSPGRSMFVGNFFLNNALAGAIELPTLVGCVYLLQFGRKRSQVITLISAGILIFIAILASLKEEMTFSLIFMLAGKACIQGAFNILYIFTSELYPTIIRNSAVGLCSMIGRVGAGASGYIAILSDITLPIVPMTIFCLFSLFAGVLIYFLPETRDLPLPDTLFDAVTMLKNNDSYRCAAGIEKSPINDDNSEHENEEYKPDPKSKQNGTQQQSSKT